ncbi:MAG: S53 family peptidase [Acidimicrobiales bacterium]
MTVVLARAEALAVPPERCTAEELLARHGAPAESRQALGRRVAALGLTVTGEHLPSRRVFVEGDRPALAALARAAEPGGDLARHVLAVLGMQPGPIARPHYRRADRSRAVTAFSPPQVAGLYDFPPGVSGAGQGIAIVELGGGYAESDLQDFFGGLGLPVPAVRSVGVDGAANVAGQDPQGADPEVLLDIEVAGSVAPGASIAVYFAPNTDKGFVDAVSEAAHASPTPECVSISWGGPESSWSAGARTALDQALADAAALGVTVTVASGDSGSSDGTGAPAVDFPASSPHALACGGTHLVAASDAITDEVVWNDGTSGGATGGGVSTTFAVPPWQAAAEAVPGTALAGRGVPDVAGDADPQTGYDIFVDGSAEVVGGTSAVAPLWAGLIALAAEHAGRRLGLVAAALYPGLAPGVDAPGFRDITSGDNGAYQAKPGWDACTGLGSPVGTTLASRLATATHPPAGG